MPSRMTRTASSVERSRSVSSTRRMNLPPLRRAYSQLKSAVRTPPTCSRPVGLGAKRVTTVMDRGAHVEGGAHVPKPRHDAPCRLGPRGLCPRREAPDLPWVRSVYRLAGPQKMGG